ncbi:hypothetical protein TNCV_1242261 [Trichonephila clavipes]|nr:hypothetical protein TNCV_1242261 [Trichonephila clavipes]
MILTFLGFLGNSREGKNTKKSESQPMATIFFEAALKSVEAENTHVAGVWMFEDWDQLTGNTMLNVPLHHYADVAMFEHNERCEQGRCYLGTHDILPEREYNAKSEEDLQECFDDGYL